MTSSPVDASVAPPGPGAEGRSASPSATRRGRGVQAALVAAAGLLVLGAGVAFWPDRDGTFCERVAQLPSIAVIGADGTPAAALAASAAGYDRVAAAAPDEATARAASVVAAHQRGLSDAVAGASSSDEIVDQVQALDAAELERATATLDDEVARRCG